MSETDYYQHTLELLEDSYVAADERGDLAGGSGSGGGLARWQRKRKVIAAAFDHDGTWLDVGCANGLLMETLCRWAADRNVRVEPYGLELSQRVAQRARLRLTRWAERIWSGNVMTWMPPMRFDYVTLLPEFVPTELRGAMLVRVRDQFSEAGRKADRQFLQTRCGAGSTPPRCAVGAAVVVGARFRGRRLRGSAG